MRNLPMFTTENGAAALILEEIPYTGNGYVRLHASVIPEALLAECADFCRVAGAKRLYAAGHPVLEAYPLHTAVVELSGARESLQSLDASLFPVTGETLSQWRALYREKMAGVPNAAWMTEAAAQQMLDRGEGYFVHRDGVLLGIGRICGDTIAALAAAVPGAGETVVRTLASAMTGDRVRLEVATANTRAMRLYERLGFLPVRELSRWYQIF